MLSACHICLACTPKGLQKAFLLPKEGFNHEFSLVCVSHLTYFKDLLKNYLGDNYLLSP